MLQSFLSIPKIPDLWRKVKYTLLLIAIYRLAAAVPSPFLDLQALARMMDTTLSGRGILQFVSLFTGGAFERMTVLALGIMPYITASIIIQLLGFVIPSIERMMKEGEAGKKKINDWTRYGTIGICAVQSIGIAIWLLNPGGTGESLSTIPDHPVLFTLFIMFALTTGSTFLMWLGEKISENGIGNGISLIITISIIATYPYAIGSAFTMWMQGLLHFGWIVGITIITLGTMVLCVLVTASRAPAPWAASAAAAMSITSQVGLQGVSIQTSLVLPG